MTEPEDPRLIHAMWQALDLTRAYLSQDRVQVARCLAGLDISQLERVLTWLILDHDALFDELGQPPMLMRELGRMGALAPLETELAMMTAVRRVATGEGLTEAVEGLVPLDRVHAIAICTAVMLLEARGRSAALESLDAATMRYKQMGYPRPSTAP
ncbi:hypothetical protein [Streptomyces leeuwenhoekii]|uniref:Uncharacterized protein n=1 Tax=Streptomyces leeuwenhoekii TaxID=1437453 RepID=A0A0F7VYC3_STRLW|nr:hypothetical protein [Streptomyces leeuwenhoekii]CQR61811.1 Hypothetical Protein sle_23500 [Streptomyces leeuwenhoekii]